MKEKEKNGSAKQGLVLLILALAVARLVYGVLSETGLRETSALFIGLPALLAIIMTLTPNAKSVTGMIIKGMIIAMLMSGIILQEGFVCVLLASPLFLAVGLIIGKLSDANRENRVQANALLLIPFLFLSLEGTSEGLSFNREQAVVVERILPVNASEIEMLLAQTPEFKRQVPPFLQLGFPRPSDASGMGLSVGSERIITFTNGVEEVGQLNLVVNQFENNSVQFQAIYDNTPIAEWLTWQTTEIQWQTVDENHTAVILTITTERRLAPYFYFAPLERFGVEQAANYLTDSLFALDGFE